jgi:hypothetical protein
LFVFDCLNLKIPVSFENITNNNGNFTSEQIINSSSNCSYVFNNYTLRTSFVRNNDLLWDGITNKAQNILSNTIKVPIVSLINALVFNNNNSLRREFLTNINSNDGTFNITLSSGGNFTVLDNYNITEGYSRDNDPIWFSLSNEDTIHIASNLTDTINVSFYISPTRKCKGLAKLTYTSENGYTFTYYERDAEKICEQMQTTGYVLPIDKATNSNVLDFTYLLSTCSSMNEVILDTIGWTALIFLVIIFGAIMSVVLLSLTGYFNLTGATMDLSNLNLSELNWKTILLTLFVVLLIITVIVAVTVLFNAQICALGS